MSMLSISNVAVRPMTRVASVPPLARQGEVVTRRVRAAVVPGDVERFEEDVERWDGLA